MENQWQTSKWTFPEAVHDWFREYTVPRTAPRSYATQRIWSNNTDILTWKQLSRCDKSIFNSQNVFWLIYFWQRCKNVQTCKQCSCKKNLISGKIFAKFYAVLSRKLVMSRFCAFWWHFLAHFGSLCLLRFFVRIRFLVIYALFWVKYTWLK